MALDSALPASKIPWPQLTLLLVTRLILSTAFRILYPLLAFLAGDFAVSLQTASLLVTVQVAASLLSPVGGALADARGERAAMTAGLACFTLGTAVCAVAGGFWLFLIGYGLIGLGIALFTPAVQVYASKHSPYSQRGRVLGFLELSWALAALIGVAGLTQLVELQGDVTAAFAVLCAAGATMLVLTLVFVKDDERPKPALNAREKAKVRRGEGLLDALRSPGVAAALGFVALQMFATELIFVAYAAWLEADFSASMRSLGLVFGLLGIAELGGSIAATLFTDRLGKRRAVLIGFAATAFLMAALPWTEGRWVAFIALFLLFDLCFEFAIVSVFPLVIGLGGAARGTVIALTVSFTGLGRIMGSFAGPRLFESFGFVANGLLAGAVALLAVGLGIRMLREDGFQSEANGREVQA